MENLTPLILVSIVFFSLEVYGSYFFADYRILNMRARHWGQRHLVSMLLHANGLELCFLSACKSLKTVVLLSFRLSWSRGEKL